MREIEKILRSENKLTYKNIKSYKNKVTDMEKVLKEYSITYQFKNDFDFFYFETIVKSIESKRVLETTYDQVRNELFEIWDHMSYNERNGFMNDALKELKNGLLSFKKEDKIIYITFFDELLNTLYEKEFAVFELPQFYKLYKVFSDKFVERYHYGILPYSHGFASCMGICESENGFVLYDENMMSFYIVLNSGENFHYSLNKIKAIKTLPMDKMIEMGQIFLSQDKMHIISCLIESNMLSRFTVSKLEKLKKRGIK